MHPVIVRLRRARSGRETPPVGRDCFHPKPPAAVQGRLLPWSLIGFLAVAVSLRAPADIFVAPNGADHNAGTRSRPLASLEAARDAVRKLKSEGRVPKGGLTVWLRGGDYVRTNTFELTPADSGSTEAPVVWRAYQNESPRLLGGVVLPPPPQESDAVAASPRARPGGTKEAVPAGSRGWGPVTDATTRDRLAVAARDHVLRLDLRALGLTRFGELKSRGFGRPEAIAHSELFYDGRPMVMARWPNEGGFAKIAGFPAAAGHNDEHGGSIGRLESGFTYAGDQPRRWTPTGDIWVHGYWAWDWANSYEHVASIDVEQRLVKTLPPYGQYGFRKDQRFYFLNVLEELDQAGEWFLDRQSGELFFWPPPRSGAGETVLSLLGGPLIRMNGASHVTVRGLALEAARGNAVEIHGGQGNRVAGCLIRNLGNNGVTIEGGSDHGVMGCDVFDTGDGGVSLTGGDRKTLTPAGHFVENCHFARQGRWSKCYVPAVHLQGVGLRASRNLIHDHPHCAILFWGNDHLIEGNEIHHVALETGDVGAIYTGRDYTFRGNRIRHNFIHHTGGVGMGSMGVYMDDCVSGTEISGNVFYKVQRAAFLGGGRDHHVENNVFVECNSAVELDGRGLDRSPVWHDMVDKTMRERLADVPLALYREHYPALKTLDACYGPPEGPAITGDAFKGVPPEGNVVVHNICVGKWLNIYWHATREMLRLDANWVGDDPGFVRPIDDTSGVEAFALKSGSPARQLGFQPIPTDEIGLSLDGLRRELAARLRTPGKR